jgi:hypothetical protein
MMKIQRRCLTLPQGTALFAIAWTAALLVAAYDCYFAWQYREVLGSWELNPLVLWLAARIGLLAVIGIKLLGLTLAAGLAWHCRRARPPLSRSLTQFVFGVYALLAVHYVVSHQQLTEYDLACQSHAMLQNR